MDFNKYTPFLIAKARTRDPDEPRMTQGLRFRSTTTAIGFSKKDSNSASKTGTNFWATSTTPFTSMDSSSSSLSHSKQIPSRSLSQFSLETAIATTGAAAQHQQRQSKNPDSLLNSKYSIVQKPMSAQKQKKVSSEDQVSAGKSQHVSMSDTKPVVSLRVTNSAATILRIDSASRKDHENQSEKSQKKKQNNNNNNNKSSGNIFESLKTLLIDSNFGFNEQQITQQQQLKNQQLTQQQQQQQQAQSKPNMSNGKNSIGITSYSSTIDTSEFSGTKSNSSGGQQQQQPTTNIPQGGVAAGSVAKINWVHANSITSEHLKELLPKRPFTSSSLHASSPTSSQKHSSNNEYVIRSRANSVQRIHSANLANRASQLMQLLEKQSAVISQKLTNQQRQQLALSMGISMKQSEEILLSRPQTSHQLGYSSGSRKSQKRNNAATVVRQETFTEKQIRRITRSFSQPKNGILQLEDHTKSMMQIDRNTQTLNNSKEHPRKSLDDVGIQSPALSMHEARDVKDAGSNTVWRDNDCDSEFSASASDVSSQHQLVRRYYEKSEVKRQQQQQQQQQPQPPQRSRSPLYVRKSDCTSNLNQASRSESPGIREKILSLQVVQKEAICPQTMSFGEMEKQQQAGTASQSSSRSIVLINQQLRKRKRREKRSMLDGEGEEAAGIPKMFENEVFNDYRILQEQQQQQQRKNGSSENLMVHLRNSSFDGVKKSLLSSVAKYSSSVFSLQITNQRNSIAAAAANARFKNLQERMPKSRFSQAFINSSSSPPPKSQMCPHVKLIKQKLSRRTRQVSVESAFLEVKNG